MSRSTRAARERWRRYSTYYQASENQRMERLAFGDSRAWVCRQATGRTLEITAGAGRNLAHYPVDVNLTGIDLSPEMLDVTRKRAAELGRPIELVEGDAERLPFADAAFDAVVCTLGVCEIPDRAAAIAEMYRVLRPGGHLLLLDHFEWRWLRRRPGILAKRQGFAIERRRRLRLGVIERLAARKPAA